MLKPNYYFEDDAEFVDNALEAGVEIDDEFAELMYEESERLEYRNAYWALQESEGFFD